LHGGFLSEVQLTVMGALRWILEVGIVLITSLLVLLWQRNRAQRRSFVM